MSDVKGTSVGFHGLLAILFIGLKLGSVIAWSWWWVLSPLWIPFVMILSLGFVYVVVKAVVD